MDPATEGGRKIKSVIAPPSHETLHPPLVNPKTVLQGKYDFCHSVGERRGSAVTLLPRACKRQGQGYAQAAPQCPGGCESPPSSPGLCSGAPPRGLTLLTRAPSPLSADLLSRLKLIHSRSTRRLLPHAYALSFSL